MSMLQQAQKMEGSLNALKLAGDVAGGITDIACGEDPAKVIGGIAKKQVMGLVKDTAVNTAVDATFDKLGLPQGNFRELAKTAGRIVTG